MADAAFPFFFYGSLRDPDVRAAVIGQAVATTAAALPGWRVVPVEHGRYPMIVADPAGTAQGEITPALGLDAAARLSFFEEDGHYYTCRKLAVAGEAGPAPAWVYVPTGTLKRGGGAWDIAAWAPRFKRDFLLETRRIMARYGNNEAERFAALWRGRAAAGR
jgi:gamma-glutamylcyclotransferase (GGCT)/AIG2-like uncharacterized protein YtfP